jgi:NADP-dependent 3-hydroxy acid dehydrogenase YdfG
MTGVAGQTAVVTGASRGIGLAIASMLIGEGVRVVMVARGADALAARAEELGPFANALVCDVGDPAAIARAIGRIRELYSAAPDIIVNNAGIFSLAPVELTSVDDLRQALDVNVIGPFVFVQGFLGDLRARRAGHIITVGSIADHAALPENAAYGASKFAARGLHEVLRLELRGSGVRTTLVSPGPVDTPLWDDIHPETRPGFTPRSGMLQADAVAHAVRYALTQPSDVNVDEIRVSRS